MSCRTTDPAPQNVQKKELMAAPKTLFPKGSVRLCVAMAVIAVVWLVVLPRFQRLAAVDRHLRLLDAKQIDASALFYTDLDLSFLRFNSRPLPQKAASPREPRRSAPVPAPKHMPSRCPVSPESAAAHGQYVEPSPERD
jgi:hypothetical protein